MGRFDTDKNGRFIERSLMSRILFPSMPMMLALLKLVVWEMESIHSYPSIGLSHNHYISPGDWNRIYKGRKRVGLPTIYWMREE